MSIKGVEVKEKSRLRQEMLQVLKCKSNAERKKEEDEIFREVVASPYFKNAKGIGVYLSMRHEVGTQKIVDYALKCQKVVCVPKVLDDSTMVFCRLESSTVFVKNKYGILEPQDFVVVGKDDIDLIIVPGLAFHESGHRLGYGKGYYDRYLADFRERTVGLAFKQQVVGRLWNVDEYDIKIDELQG